MKASTVLFGLMGGISAIVVVAQRPAQAQLPTELEGPIQSIVASQGQALVRVMGIQVVVTGNTVIESPTKRLSLSELLTEKSFPGLTQPGFLGGTAIVTGTTLPNGSVLASEIAVEPAENIILGVATTKPTNGDLGILGTPVRLVSDSRLPSKAVNALGFGIRPETVLAGAEASAEGYYGSNGVFYAFLVEANGGLTMNGPQTSVLRARCQPGGRLEVRGGSTSGTGTVQVFNGSLSLGTATVVADAELPPFGAWQLRVNPGTCPTRIRVTNSNGSSVQADVTVQ